MASFPDVPRDTDRSAEAETVGVLVRGRLALSLAALSIAALGTVVAIVELATLHRSANVPAHAPAFLTKALGPAAPSRSLVRTPAPDVQLAVRGDGFTLAAPEGALGLSAVGAANGAWDAHAHGAVRATPAGPETVTLGRNAVEEYRTVTRHHGLTTWRWRLATSLEPRLSPSGWVGFFAGNQLTPLALGPVRILDDRGRDVTPKRLRWRVARGELSLTLDDRTLPLPYTIDPSAFVSAVHTAHTGTGTYTLAIPAAVVPTDLIVLHEVTTRVKTTTFTAPSDSTGNAWKANAGLDGGTFASNDLSSDIWWKFAGASDANASVTITPASGVTSTSVSVASISVFKGLDATKTGLQTAQVQGAAGAARTATCPAVTPTSSAQEHIVCFESALINGTWSSPGTFSPWTYVADSGTTSTSASTATFDDEPVSSTATIAAATGTSSIFSTNKERFGAAMGWSDDTTAPSTPTAITGSAFTNASQGTGSFANHIYIQSGASGGFTITGSGAADAQSGIASYDYPSLTGYSDNGAGTYTFTGSSTTQSGSVTATNNAALTSGGYAFTVEADGTAPTGGAFAANGTAATAAGSTSYLTSGTTLTINSRTDYSETQSSTQAGMGSSTLTIESAPLSGDTCGAYGSPTTITGTTSQTVASGNCYLLTLTGTDAVGNATSISTTVMVDTTPPSAPTGFTASALTNAFQGTGAQAGIVYFLAGGSGSFTVTATGASDADTGIAGYAYPALSGFTGIGTYAFSGSSTTQSGSIAAQNHAGLTGSGITLTAQADGTPPSGGALTVNGTAATAGGSTSYLSSGTTLTIDSRTDYTETQSATESGLGSSTLVIRSAPLANDTCGTFGSPTTISGTQSQTVASGNCYLLKLTGTDNVGNAASISTTVKVDTTAPSAPSGFTASSLTHAFQGTGAQAGTVYFRTGSSGGFTVSAAGATDSETSIGTYNYPTLPGFSGTGTYTFDGSSTTQSGSITATNTAGLTGPGITLTAQSDGTAPTGGALTVNGGNAYLTSGTTLTIDSRTDYAEAQSATESGLASSVLAIQSAPLSGDTCGTYGSPTTITGTASQTVASGNCYLLTLTGTDNVGNTATVTKTVKVDTSAPSAPTGITASGLTNAFASGNTVYFQAGATGGFTISASGATDAETGVSSYTYPALAGFAGSGGAYTFTGSSTTQTGSIAATNGAGVSGAGLSFTAQADGSAPSGGAFSANGTAATAAGSTSWLSSGTTLTIDSRTDYSETQTATESGLASSTLTIESAPLANDTCGTYGSPTTITGTQSQTVASGNCYLLTLTGTDNVGNATSISTTVMVDTTPPSAPTGFTASALTNAFQGTGAQAGTVYFMAGSSGGFTVTGTGAADGDSGIAGYTYPTLSGFGGSGTYTFTGASTTQTGSIAATNHAGLTGSGYALTAQADGTPPTGGALTANGTAATAGGSSSWLASGTTLTIDSRTDYTEAQSATQSGLASSTLTIRSATLSGTTCGTFGSPTTISGTPSQTVSSGNCYLLTLTGTDNVGNTTSKATTVKVDTTAPSAPTAFTTTGLTNAVQGTGANASTVYFRSGASGGFTVSASGATDAESGISTYSYPSLTGFGGNGTYTFDGSSATQSGSITATNGAGLAGPGLTLTAQADGTAPTGGALTVNGGNAYLTSGTTLTIDSRTDYTEAQSATQSGLASSVLTIQSATLSGDTCGAYGSPTTISGTTSQTVATGNCYLLTLTGTDNVGNTASVTRVVKVDTTAPSAPTGITASGLTNAFAAGSTVYFKSGASGAFTVTANGAADADTNIAGYTYPALAGFGGTGTYSFDASSTSQSGSITATNGAGTVGAGFAFTAQADGTAPTGGALAVNGSSTTSYLSSGTSVSIAATDFAEAPSATESGLASNVLTVKQGTLSNDTCGSYGSPTTLTGQSSYTVADGSCYLFTLTGTDNVGNSASVSVTVKVDTSAPTAPTLSFGSLTNAYASGTTVYFQGGANGGFTVSPNSSDPDSGVSSYAYPSLGAGFGNTGGSYTFDATAATASGAVTATNGAGLTGSGTTFTAQADTQAPTGGDLTVNGGAAYLSSGTSVSIATTDFAETQSATQSGLASNALTVQSATLANDACGSYGSATDITGQSSYAVASGTCYRFTLTGTDDVGNTATVTRTIKVDTTAPDAPSLSFSNLANAYASGSTVYFKAGATGAFTVDGAATDAESGVASYTYPALGTGFSHTGGDYTFDGTAATQSGAVTATNGAGLTGTGTTFTAQADANAPTGGALAVDGSSTTSYLSSGTSVSIAATDFAETQSATESGLASNTLTVKQAPLSSDSCQSYGSPTDITGQSTYAVASGNCYLFTLTGVDNVGNAASVGVTVKVDTSAPSAPTDISVGGATNAYYPGTGTTIFFQGGASGSFTVSASGATDGDSGIDHYDYGSLTGFGGSNGSYTFDASSTTQSTTATATNGAGLTGAGLTFTAQADSTAPTGGALTVNGGNAYLTSGSTLTIDSRTDYAEAPSATESGLASSVLTIQTGTLSHGTCSSYGSATVISGTAPQSVTDGHCYLLTLTGTDNVGNTASVTRTVKVDESVPTAPALSFSGLSNAYASGNTVYFQTGSSGGFTVDATATDAESDVASYSFPALSGFGGSGGVYTFDGSSQTQSGAVTATSNAGSTGPATTLTAQADGTAPTGGALTVNGVDATTGGSHSYLTSGTTLTIDGRTDYTETQTATQSGLASSVLKMRTGTLTGDTCSGYGSAVTIPGTQSQTVASGNCYLFTLTGTDEVGNSDTIQTTVKVDTTPPTAPAGFGQASGLIHASYPGSGTTVYFKGGSTGAFTVTGTGSADPESGVAAYGYSALTGFGGSGGAYTFDPSSTTQTGSITATDNAGLTGAGLSFTAQADTTAPTGGDLTVNGGSAYLSSGTSVSIAATDFVEARSATESGLAGNTLTVESAPLSAGTCGSYGSTTDITGQSSYAVASGNCYRFTLTGTDNVGNAASVTRTVQVDTTAPSAPAAITVGGTTNAYYPGSGTTVYFQGGTSGGFTVAASGATDAESGIAGYTYPSLTGFGGSGGSYTFDASSTTQSGSATATDGAGLTGSGLAFTAQDDTTAPGGGVLDVNGGDGWTSGTTVSIDVTPFAEAQTATQSGLASNVLTVETADLTGNSCSTYDSPVDITGHTSQAVADGHCYRFTLTGTDNVGNTATLTSVVKVDVSGPTAPTLSFSSLTNAYASGDTVYFEAGTTGGFTVDASSTDPSAGIASYSFPSLTGFSNTGGVYGFDASSTTQSGDVTSTNNAGTTGPATTFTAQADGDAPTGGALTVNGGAPYLTSGTSVSIAATDFSETQSATESGLAGNTLTVKSAPLAADACGTYGTATDITGQSSYTVASGNCYAFTLTGTDNVGNAASITRTVKVDTSAPSAPTGITVTSPANAYYPGSGTTVYFQGGTSGSFTLGATGAADAETGPVSYDFPALPGFAGRYTFDASSSTQTGSITATNAAGLTSSGLTFTAQADTHAPTGGALTVNGGNAYLTSGTSVSIAATDFAETQSATESGLAGNTLTVQSAPLADGACGAYGSASDITGQSSYTVASGTCYRFTLTGTDEVGNSASVSAAVEVDTTAPTAPTAIAVGGTTNAYYPGTGTTVYFRGGASGGFTVAASGATDADSGVASYAYGSLAGFGGSGGAYTFDASSTTQSASATATNGAGLTGPGLAFTAQADTTPPTGGSLTVNGGGGYLSSGTSVSIAATGFAETQSATESGLAGNTLTVESAPLANDTCGTYGSATDITGQSSYAVTTGACYRFTLTGADEVGNTATVTRTVKVDTTAPSAPTLAFSGLSNAYASGDTVYFRAGSTGTFTVVPTSTDADTGVASYGFPGLTGFSNTAGDYSFDASSTTGSGDVAATNGAGATGPATTFTAQADGTAPTGGALTVNGGDAYATSGTSVPVAATDYVEAPGTTESGLASSVLTVQTGDLSGDTCSGYGAATDISGQSSYAVSSGHCYEFTLTGTDHVGNTASITRTVKVDTSAPSAPSTLTFGGLSNAYYPGTGSTVWFRGGAAGGFTVTASGATDAESGISGYTYPALTGFGGSGGSYTFDASSTTQSGSITATNGAGASGAGASFTARADSTAPSTAITCNGSACPGGWTNSAPVDIAIDATDGGSDVASVTYTTDGSDPTTSGTATTVDAATAAFQISAATTIRWFATDNVGNASTPQSVTVQVDTTPPTAPTTFAVTGTTHAWFDGDHTIFFQGGGSGGFTLTASGADDPQSGVDHYDYPSLAGFGGTGGAYTFDASSTTQTGSVTATNGAATAGPGKSFTAQSDSSAPTSSVACDGAACSGTWYTTSPVQVALSADDGSGAGVQSITYTTDGTDPATSGTATTVAGGSATVDVTAPGTTTVTWIATDRVGNVSPVQSQDVELDTTPPSAPSLSFSGAYASGNRVYFKAGTSGSFTVAASSADAESGVASYAYPTLTGFTNTNGDYSFDASSTTQSGAVTATNGAGLTGTGTTFTAQADGDGPTGGAIVVNGGNPYASGSSVSIDVTDFAEARSATESGLAGNALTVESAPLAADSCGSYGAPTDITGQSSYAVSGATCYRFTLTGTDNVGNTSSVSQTVEVDTTAPTGLALSFANATGGAYYPGSGPVVYVDPSTAGSIDVTATATDPETGVGYTFPSVGGNWSTSGTGATRTFSYTAPAGASGTETVTATNAAGGTATTSFDLTPDTTAPITTALCNGSACGSGWFTSAPVTLTLDATDGGSGVQQTRYTTDGSTPTPISGTAYTGPISVNATTTFTFRSWDEVGNAEPPTTLTIQVDSTPPTLPALSLGESSPDESVTGTTLYYNPSGSNSGSFTVTAAPSDAESGIDRVTFPSLTGMTGGGDVTGAPYTQTYSWDSSATTEPGAATVTARDGAGLTSTQGFTVAKDDTPPSGTSISYAAGYDTTGSVSFTTADGTDAGAGVATGSGVVERRTAPLADGTCGSWSGWTAVAGSPDSVPTDTCVQYRYRISDKVGNEQVATGGTVMVDTTAPTSTIQVEPGDPSSVTTPTFQFSASESSTFECDLDSAGWASCSSPDTLAALGEGSHTFQVRATDLAGNVGAAASYTWFVDLTAPTVSVTAPADGANVSGSVTVTASATDNHDSSPAVVLQERRQGASSWTDISSPWDTTALADGYYELRAVATDSAGNSGTSATTTVDVDNHAPSISFSAPGQYVNAASPSSIPVTVTSGDGDIASVQFYECSNGSATCAGGTWNAVGSAVTTAPWTTSWTPPASDGTKELKAVATDLASNVGTATTVVTIDRTAPSGVTISYPDGYSADGSVSIATGNGPDSDVDASSGSIERRTATLSGDACGTWSGWTPATASDTVADATCAQYRYTVSDLAGNATTVVGSGTVKVDETAPSGVSLAFGGLDHASASGSTVYVAPGTAGGFTVTASGSDPQSGISATGYPSLGTGWSNSGGAYSFDASASAPSGPQTVTVTNGAGLTTSAAFDVVADGDAPTGGSVSYADGFQSAAAVDVTLAAGTDNGGSGIGSKVLERADATLSAGTCGTFGAFATVATDPSSPYTDSTVTGGNCYEYRYVVTDAVGNVATYTSSSVAKIDTAAPTATMTDPGTEKRGTITLAATASDTGGSGIDHVAFQIETDGGSTWTTVGTASSAPYSISFDTTSPQLDGSYDFRAVAVDQAGNSTASAAVGPDTIDNTPPNTTIGTKPSDPSNVSSPTFGFASSEPSSTYECRVDGAAFTACANPITLPSLGEGPHTLDVRATDLAGNTDPTPASYTWTIDTVPPAASMSDPGAHLSGTVALQGTSTDVGGTGVASESFEVSPAGAGTWTPISASWDTTTVADGLYDLHVIAKDNAGNVATSAPISNVRVDNTPPSVTITTPASSADVTGSVSLAASIADADPSPSVTWKYKLSTDSTWTALPGSTWDTVGLHLPDGKYDVEAVVTDWAGNTTTASSTNVVVDNQAPTVGVTTPADSSYVNAASPDPSTLTADANDNGTGVKQVAFYQCPTSDCASRTLVGTDSTGSSGHYSVAWSIPADGSYWIEAEASDMVGHTSTSTVAVTVDRTLPDTTIETKPGDPTNDAHPAFTFSASEPTQRYECSLDGGAWTTCATPYSLAATPADGSHTLQVRAVDLAGNTDASPASWTWLEDRTPPTATLDDPAAANAAHAIRGTVALGATTADPGPNASGLESTTYEYSMDGTTWVPIADPSAWDTTGITDGIYQLHVVVTDKAGNTTTSAPVTNLKIDNTQPVTAQDDPGQYLRATVHLTATAADPNDPEGNAGSGIDHVDFQVSPAGQNSWTTVGTSTTEPYAYDFDTTTLADGTYDFRTVAYDVAGNSQAAAPVTSRLVDNTKPTVTLANPGTNLRGTVQLTDTATDPGTTPSGVASTTFEISADGTNWTPVGSSWDTTGVADGVYSIRVSVADRAGNVSDYSSVSNVRVDNTPPTTTASGVPSGFSSTDVTVTLNASDGGSGVSDTLYQVDGGAVQHGTSVVIPAPANGSNDGAHTISFQSVDAAGNVEAPHSVTVEIDATPPACPSCSAADYMRGTVTLSATPTAGVSGIKDVKFSVSPHGAGTWTLIGTDSTGSSGTYSAQWDTTSVSDGYYDLRYTVTSNSGATTDVDLDSKVVDNTAPTVAVGAPAGGAIVGGSSVTISATAHDANALTYDFLVDGSQIASGSSPSTTWDSTSVGDGTHTLQVRATDPAGNSTTSASVQITVDNHAPTPTLNGLGGAVAGTTTLGVSTDGDTAHVEYQERAQGASTWSTIGTTNPPFAQSWDTTGLTDGTYELRAVATDEAGHTGTSPTLTTVVDNTAPTGSIATPALGATVGGPNITISATASDGGSGVKSVEFECTPDGTNTWTPIATVTSAPYETPWPTSACQTTGDYDLQVVVTDNAGNQHTSTSRLVHLDATAPTVTFDDPGTSLSGTVPLTATTGGTTLTFEYSVAGANAWHTIATDTAAPWKASFDTTSLPDGLYDLRASAADSLGNVGTDEHANVRIDNHLPTIASSTPADGSTVTSASSVTAVLSELATLSDVTLDGNPTAAPTVTGTQVLFPTGTLAPGSHTLAMTLTDEANKTSQVAIHFTVYDPSSNTGGTGTTATPPPVEANVSTAAPTTVTAADGTWSMTIPADAMPAGTTPDNWVVVRLAPTTPAAVPPPPAGVAMKGVVEIIAKWVQNGGELHQFADPLDIAFQNAAGLVPATAEDGQTTWHMIPKADGTTIPADQPDGYYRVGSTLHVLTHHLSLFGLVVDTSPPGQPKHFNATVNDGDLYLRWDPADEGGAAIANYVVYEDGTSVASLGATEYQYDAGPYDPADPHSYRIVAVDASGNTGAATDPLEVLPQLVGLTPDEAGAALTAKGFAAGAVTDVPSAQPAGTVVGPLAVAAAPGSAVPLQVSAGGGGVTKLVLSVVGSRRVVVASQKYIGVHLAATRATTVTATLTSPRGKALYTWHRKARAGATILKLPLPRRRWQRGTYTLRWTAVAGADVAHNVTTVEILRTKRDLAKRLPSSVGVVVTGNALPADLPLPGDASKTLTASSEESAFELTGDPKNNVTVLVVDADAYTLQLIHDLHVVFPNLKLIALSNKASRLTAAVRAGATVGLPKTTPVTKLAKAVATLVGPVRTPATTKR